MPKRGQDIVSVLKKQIEEFQGQVTMVDVGTVVEVGDGIARVQGLSKVRYNELLNFSDDIVGIALNLEEDTVGVAIMGDAESVKEGDIVKATGTIVEVPVGEELIGRVVYALGQPLDGKGPINAKSTFPVERIAPNVVAREAVDTPVQTGIKAIDSMVPIGRGQRELIIGDRSIGKSAIVLDAIINQKDQDLFCIYVAIGQKQSKVAQVVQALEEAGAMKHTIVVAANASDAAPLQYIAPYAGCAMGEYLMSQGKDVLIAYDDLSKHAWAYRQVSLLLRRPAGREAYPGDLFYLHSRLLERAAKLSAEHGGGSLTALPIIETQAGDVSAYVPTNVISITDGQIYLENELFNAGIRPAINAGLSVSRVGSAAQSKAMKNVASSLRLNLAQYSALAAFAQFGTSDLDDATRAQLERGRRSMEILKQEQFVPLSLAEQVTVLFAINNGLLDEISVEQIKLWEQKFREFIQTKYSDINESINESGTISDEIEKKLTDVIKEFNEMFNSTK